MPLTTEVWSRPGAATYGRVIDGVPDVYQTCHSTFNGVGDGSWRVPNTFDRFAEILDIDEATPANTVNSTVKVFDTADLTTPIFEWLPSQIVPVGDKFDFDVDIYGRDINSIMSYARVEAYDWDGSDDWVPSVADWVWGGDNILTNADFENTTGTPTEWELNIAATGGTYTLTDGTDTTSAINFDAQASTIETRLQTDIASITDVVVTGTSVSPYLRTITLLNPLSGVSLSINTGSLTGGSGTLTGTQEGFTGFQPWTNARALTVSIGPENYDAFEISTAQAFTGSQSLLVNPGTIFPLTGRNPGIQQVVSVTPGQTYQLSIRIYPTSATDRFRLGVFTTGEELVAWTASSGTTLTINTWNQLTLPDVVIPDGVTQVIFRTAVTNSTATTYNPSAAYYDAAQMLEGLVPTSVGGILEALYDDATVDHVADGRLVWEDLANPGNPYLTLDFTDSLDSAGDAWFVDDVSIKLWMRMSYLQVLDQLAATFDIEWRVVADDVETGQYKLQVYNPGGMATDYTMAATPAIQGGSQDVRRSILKFLPNATNHLVEGESRITARRDTTGLETAIGRMEGNVLDRQAPTIEAAQETAFVAATDTMSNAQPYQYDLVNPQDRPLYAYTIGDILTVHDPPEVDDTARLIDVEIVDTPQQTIYSCQFAPTTAAGS